MKGAFQKQDKAATASASDFSINNPDTLELEAGWAAGLCRVLALAALAGAWVGLNQGRKGYKVTCKVRELSSADWYSSPLELLELEAVLIDLVRAEAKPFLAARRKAGLAIFFDTVA